MSKSESFLFALVGDAASFDSENPSSVSINLIIFFLERPSDTRRLAGVVSTSLFSFLFMNFSIENINNIKNGIREVLERREDRLASERLPISERYIKGRLEVLAELNITHRGCTYQYAAIFHRARPQFSNETISNGEVLNSNVVNNSKKSCMFIGNVQIMNSSQFLVSSSVRLQPANYIDDIFSGPSYVSTFYGIIKAVKPFAEREANAACALPFKSHHIAHQEIEWSPQVVDYISDDCGEFARDFIPNPKCPEVIRGFCVLLDDDSIGFRINVVDDAIIEVSDVLLRTIDL